MRIVSLLASATEIVCALGAGDWLVGRSHECDNPAWVRALPACSEPAFDISMPSRAIDAEVRRRIQSGEPLYTIHTELIRSLRPDLVVTQSHCQVCAVTPEDVHAVQAGQLSLAAGSLDGIFGDIRRVADRLGLAERGEALIDAERRRLDAVRARTAALPRPRVVMIEWTEPLFSMGNWGPELVAIAGGDLRIGRPGEYSTTMTPEQLATAAPEIVVIAPCGFGLARTIREAAALARTIRNARVALADGNLYFNRSGMTVARTAEILADILHGGDPEEEVWQWAQSQCQ